MGLSDWLLLTAGPLTMRFEARNAFLRHIRLGDTEVLRGVYAAVRDPHWSTIEPRVRIQVLDRKADSFFVLYEADARDGDIRLQWTGTIRGSADGVIRLGFDGRARSTFMHNRIGFCILHPAAECAGRPCRIEHVDGTIEAGAFPKEIAPHQPFLNIRAITHQVADGVSAEVRMQGDVFEMEDQRNWTDASFKTYSGPLSRPHPRQMAAGTEVRQAVTLTLHRATAGAITRAISLRGRDTITGAAPVQIRQSARQIELRLGAASRSGYSAPGIGYGLRSRSNPLSEPQVELLQALRPAHVRVTLDLSEGQWQSDLEGAAGVASLLNCPIELVALIPQGSADEEQLRPLRDKLNERRPELARILLMPDASSVTPAPLVLAGKQLAKDLGLDVPVGGGTLRYFTELNRNRPVPGAFDVVAYSFNPQVHAFDNLSMVESLPTQGETVRNVREFLPDARVAVGPITLRPRLIRAEGGRLVEGPPDSRQKELFAAVWTLGSIKYLAEARAESLTYYEFTGDRGIMAGASLQVHPLYHPFADLAEMSGGEVLDVESSQPLEVEAFALRSEGRLRILLANMSAQDQVIGVRLTQAVARSGVRVRTLDEASVGVATAHPGRWRAEGFKPLQLDSDPVDSGSLREFTLSLSRHAYVCVDLDAALGSRVTG